MEICSLENKNKTGLDGEAVRRARTLLTERFGARPLALTHFFGCQQNVADGEHLNGILSLLGFGFTDQVQEADLVLFNTCAVRESAEDRVWGHIGALKNEKRRRPSMIIAIGGCMTQRTEVAEKLRTSYPYVDLVFGTGAVQQLPSLLCQRLESGKNVLWQTPADHVVEGLPIRRGGRVRAWLPIMQGCNNFCSYCIVPYVRGRETSRDALAIEREARAILQSSCREITLLGQNVNSYRPETGPSRDFATLIRQLDAIEGEHRIRFMTSHPKDCTRELLETLARTQHFCHHIHLPVQSGSDRVLAQMNRRYTAAHYLSLIDYAREVMPDVTFSSDILVGFPSETREDFEATLELVSHVRYNALFTFLYSRRSGTAAASLPDPVPADEKSLWLRELLSVQQDICQHLNEAMVGKNVCVLFDGVGKSGQGFLTGRTEGNIIVECEAPDALLGQFATVNVTRAMSGSVTGTLVTTGLLN